VWIVDPIDGTRGFLAGLPDWTISIALAAAGRPVLAALYAPVTDDLFLAAAGGGATLNGSPIAATTGRALAGARVAGPDRRLGRLAPLGIVPEPKVHSLALRIARVASGTLDIALAGPNSHDWDLAAADLLVHEAGGALTTSGGETLVYNRPVPTHGALFAAGHARHEALRELMREGRVAFG
jgi:myo-inositol-1(or 4)-monophosphatase